MAPEDAMGIMERFGVTMTAAMGSDDEPRSSRLGHGARGPGSRRSRHGDDHAAQHGSHESHRHRQLHACTDRGMRPDAGIRLEQRVLDSPRVNLDIFVADRRANRAVGARCDLARRRGTIGGRGGGATFALAGAWLGARLLVRRESLSSAEHATPCKRSRRRGFGHCRVLPLTVATKNSSRDGTIG